MPSLLLTGLYVQVCRVALPCVSAALGGDGRLAQPWPVRGGCRSLGQAAGHPAAWPYVWRPQRLAGQGRTSPPVIHD